MTKPAVAAIGVLVLIAPTVTSAQVGSTPPAWSFDCPLAGDQKAMCLSNEKEALRLLTAFWPRLPFPERERCVAQAESMQRSYVDIEVCIEQDIRELSGGPDALRSYYRVTGVPEDYIR